jgi:hypothetical protein
MSKKIWLSEILVLNMGTVAEARGHPYTQKFYIMYLYFCRLLLTIN